MGDCDAGQQRDSERRREAEEPYPGGRQRRSGKKSIVIPTFTSSDLPYRHVVTAGRDTRHRRCKEDAYDSGESYSQPTPQGSKSYLFIRKLVGVEGGTLRKRVG